VISYKNKFVFLHIPKTAGTSLEIVLEDESCSFKRCQWSKKPMGFNAPLNHLTLEQIQKSKVLSDDQLESFYKFTFVRNPWDRVISECFCGHIQPLFKGCVTIKDKIKKVCLQAKSPSGYAGHCRPYSDFIKHENLRMNFVGKFENLENDYTYLCAELNIDKKNLVHKHKSHRKNYKAYFDNETRDLVEATYLEDIELFNYSY